MNAVAISGYRHGALGAALAAVRAATTRRHRNWMLATYLTLLGIACLLGTFVPGESSRAEGLGFFAATANFSVWSGWLARLLLLQCEAAIARVPGIVGAVRHALVIAVVLTVLLPAFALLALGVPAPIAFGASALGVFGGLLFALLPWPGAVALLIVPGAWQALSSYLPPLGPSQMLAAAAVGLLVLVMCWRSVMRSREADPIPAWRRPVMLQSPGGTLVWSDPKAAAASDAPRVHEGWLLPMPRPDNAGPHAPRAAMLALLSGPMGYVATRVATRQWALVILVAVVILSIPFRGDTPLVRDALLIGGAVGLLAGGWTLAMRLERQRRRASGELAELALLPGLGDPATAATRLLRGVMGRLAQLMLFALAALLLVAWIRGATWSDVAMLVGICAGVSAASVLMCVTALTDRSVVSWCTFVVMLPLLVLSTATLVMPLARVPIGPHAIVWTIVWMAMTAGYLGAAVRPLRRFRARPHAFLMD